jgi:hypothetical protein
LSGASLGLVLTSCASHGDAGAGGRTSDAGNDVTVDGSPDAIDGAPVPQDGSPVFPDGSADGGDATTEGQPDSGDSGAEDADAGVDTVAVSFVTLGCNRISSGDWVKSADPSSANVGQLSQDFIDVSALSTPPRYFFFSGDLVLGLTSTISTLQDQLSAWTTVWQGGAIAASVPLVPMPGNHEMLKKVSGNEVPNNSTTGGADSAWLAWLHAGGFDTRAGNGPTSASPNTDQLDDDQSKLSYSFDDGGVHYVVLNTDTWTAADGGQEIGWIPLQWLTADLATAQANPSTFAIFIFGHKPIVSPVGSTDSTDVINPALTSGLESLIDGTTKVKAYFSAHYHAWDARPLPGQRGVFQVIAGNAGSSLDSTWTPPSPYFGFTEVHVHASGKVGVISHERPVPSPYNATTGISAAMPVAEMIIAP